MGTSNWQNISYCTGILRRLMPMSVLDVGTGFGRWGVLCREFLDVWEGREARGSWQVRIEGIEAFPSCLTPLHGYVYDRLHVGDAVDLLPTLGTFDVVYLGDVVEHQTKERAWAMLDLAMAHARQAAIVTIPIGDNWPQPVWDGNWYHAHRSTWYLEDFDRFPEARRQAFSDYLGRLFLVIELPGRASGQGVEARGPADASLDLPVRTGSDSVSLASLQRRLAVLESARLRWTAPVVALSETVLGFVNEPAGRPSPDTDGIVSRQRQELIERLAAAVEALAAEAAVSIEQAGAFAQIQRQLAALDPRATNETGAPSA